MTANINWYPGHMKKTRELIQENLKMVDAVIEVLDARIPVSSRNPVVDELISGKPRIVVLNKSDLADEKANRLWVERLAESGCDGNEAGESGCDGNASGESGCDSNESGEDGYNGNESGKGRCNGSGSAEGERNQINLIKSVIAANSMSGSGMKEIFRVLERMAAERTGNRAMKPFRLMIVGVPNVGKSSLINRLTGHKSAKTGDRPGVTKGKQWLRLENGMQLLDTPGILWPKFEDPKAGLNLAFCGSIKDEILDVPTLGMELIAVLTGRYPEMLAERYRLDCLCEEGEVSPETGYPMETVQDLALGNMYNMAMKRGCILPGKRVDYERIGRLVLDEFRSAKIGRITLEWPE